jgi:tetratricopeptide (TPR) repeat protein/TolB-like protein
MPHEAHDDDLVMSLVEMALARPPDDREAYLQSACAGNSELFGQVWNYVESEQRMKGFLSDPLFPRALFDHPFEPGELLDGRFRIVRELAQGGMGIVYEAMDEKLERRIALKCAKIGFRKRLPPEVRNASEISHPNVCKIFEIHTASTQQGDIDFLTMEFLDGATLAERLRGGPLPQEEARTIALQLCAGLAEAHRNRVIHGDLKSSNVILTAGGGRACRAVITDFGLARSQEAFERSMQSGALGGTPEYMAPELWMGEKASIASDIYALGVILYELASGRRPVQPEGGTGDWLGWKPPAVHPKWDRILQRCLDPDPARRFRDADAVAQVLAPPRNRRWFLAAAAAAVLAAVTGTVTYQRATAPLESVRLAILPFESGDASGPVAGRFLRDVADQVGRLKGNKQTKLEVISLSNVLRRHADSVEKASAVLGATHVLRGTIEKEKDQLKLQAFLTDARSRVDLKEWRAQYGVAEERYIPVVLASMVTETFHLPPPALAATVNAGAREDYIAGLAYLRRDSTIPAALASFERAVHADSDSPLAYAGLAEAQWFKYFLTKQRAWLDRSAESAREAERRNLDLAQVHRVAGLHLANAGSYEQASAEYRRARELEPNDAENYRRLGQVYEKNSQKPEALVAFQTAVSRQPDYYRAYVELGAYHSNRGDFTRAVVPFRKALDLAPDEPNVRFALGATYSNLGMYGEAEQQLRVAVDLDEAPKALHALGLTLMYQRRDEEAIAYFSRALRGNPENYLSWMFLGMAFRRTSRTAQAGDANRHGREVAQGELSRNPRDGYVRSILGYFAAALGDRGRAETETKQALNSEPDDAETRWTAILTYEALGERDASLAVLNRSTPLQLMDVTRWPDLADLAQDPRFLQLLATLNLK